MTKRIENFIIFPRKLAQDVRNGLLTRPEFNVYVWARLNANPYGEANLSLSNIREDVFNGGVQDNYVNKILLSLKSKRYVYYKSRKGRRGSFEIHFGDWIKPDKHIKTLDYFFGEDVVRGDEQDEDGRESEPGQSELEKSQTFSDQKTDQNPFSKVLHFERKVRASYTDTHKDKENETYRKESNLRRMNLSPNAFHPTTYEEEQCKAIALQLNEESMLFLLSFKDKHGFPIIETAWSIFQEEAAGKEIDNKRAYFNSILQRLVRGESLMI